MSERANINFDSPYGIALSGGGIRCYVHLGILSVLEEKGLIIKEVSGTSGGAIIGAFLANGLTSKEILEKLENVRWRKMVKFHFSKNGLMSLKPFESWLESHLPKRIEDLKLPLHIACSDLIEGTSINFNQGPLANLIVASSSIPFLFKGSNYNERELFDGGPTNNLPHQSLTAENKLIIHSNCPYPGSINNGFFKYLERTFQVMVANVIDKPTPHPNTVFLEPPEMSRYRIFEWKRRKEIYDFGKEYAERFLSLNSPTKTL